MKHSARIVVPLALLGALASCGDGPDALVAKAREELAAGDAQEARFHLVQALHDRPEDPEILMLLARSHLAQGDPDGAERVLARLGKNVRAEEATRLWARIAMQRGKPAEALQLLAQDRSAEGWSLRAQAHLAHGEKEQAVAAFESSLNAGADAHLAAGYARYLLGEGDLDRTEGVLHTMQARDPGAYETLVLAGDLAVAQGDEKAATAAFSKAVDAYPDRVAPMLALAEQHRLQRRFDDVDVLLGKVETIEPDNPAAATMRLRIMAEQNRWKDIRDALQTRESQLEPGSETALIYARALLNLGQPGQARLMAGRAVLMQPDNRDAQVLLAESRLAAGDPAEAWKSLRPMATSMLATPDIVRLAARAAGAVGAPEAEALARRSAPAELARTKRLQDRGEAALSAEDWSGALTIYRTLLGASEDPEVLTRLAFVSSRLGRTGEAIAYADRAMAAEGSAQYLYVAGMARLDGGVDLPRAVLLLRRAAAQDPSDTAIAEALKKAKAAAG